MTLMFASLIPLVAALDLSAPVAPIAPQQAAVQPAPIIVEATPVTQPVTEPAVISAVDAGEPAILVRAADRSEPELQASGQTDDAPVAEPEPQADEPLETLAPPPEIVLQDVVLAQASLKLRETETARGGFIQTDAYGQLTTGDFYIRRPGRIRFDYAEPVNYLVVSDGTTVAVEDRRLETMDRAPLSATPLKMFLKKDVDLTRDAKVVGVHSLPDSHLVIVEDNGGNDRVEGQLMLQFAHETFDLIGWIAIDGAGNETRVSLIDVETNVKIPARYFVIEDPEDEDDRHR